MLTLSNNNTLDFGSNYPAYKSVWRVSRRGTGSPSALTAKVQIDDAQSQLVSQRRETLEALDDDFPLNALIRFIRMTRPDSF